MLLFYLHYPLPLYPLSELSSELLHLISLQLCSCCKRTIRANKPLKFWSYCSWIFQQHDQTVWWKLAVWLTSLFLRPYDLCFWVMKVNKSVLKQHWNSEVSFNHDSQTCTVLCLSTSLTSALSHLSLWNDCFWGEQKPQWWLMAGDEWCKKKLRATRLFLAHLH